MSGPERHNDSGELKTGAVEAAAAERTAELRKQHETIKSRELEQSSEHIERARTEAHAEALFGKEQSSEHKRTGRSEEPRHSSGRSRAESYKQTMQSVKQQLNQQERTFSDFIHNPAVEKASDLISTTVARPTSILTGSILAFSAVVGLYAYASYAGFTLSGFETIGAFLIGWLAGLLIDFVRLLRR